VAADQEPKKPRTTGEPESRAATNARHRTRPGSNAEGARTRHTKEAPQADTTKMERDEGHQRTEETTTAAREKEEEPEIETTMRKLHRKKTVKPHRHGQGKTPNEEPRTQKSEQGGASNQNGYPTPATSFLFINKD